jgi:hypothetical protein
VRRARMNCIRCTRPPAQIPMPEYTACNCSGRSARTETISQRQEANMECFKWSGWGITLLCGAIVGCTAETGSSSASGAETESEPAKGSVPGGDPRADHLRSACTVGMTMCGATCVDTSTDQRSCGSCGTRCSDEDACIQGVCTRPACANGQPMCGGACCLDSESCQDGVCAPVCFNAQPMCGGTCCPPGTLCLNDVCTAGCPTGQPMCGDDTCCPSGDTCVSGVCTPPG